MSHLSFYYPELKYDSSNPNDFIGFVPLERLDATPKPTRTFFKRPSQSNAMSCFVQNHRLSSKSCVHEEMADLHWTWKPEL